MNIRISEDTCIVSIVITIFLFKLKLGKFIYTCIKYFQLHTSSSFSSLLISPLAWFSLSSSDWNKARKYAASITPVFYHRQVMYIRYTDDIDYIIYKKKN